MREETADLFEYPSDALVVPINWRVKRNGEAVMGAGVAKQAAERWPWLPARLGACVSFEGGPSVRAFPIDGFWIVCFPTKWDWRMPSDPDLMRGLLPSLLRLAERYGWQTVALPRLGCGERTGRLQWSDVRPVLAEILDSRFVVVVPPARSGGAQEGLG